MTAADDDRCGTTAGAKAHRRRGERNCPACRSANTEHVAQWRRKNPKHQRWLEQKQNAEDRARRALAKRYPAEYAELRAAELAKVECPFPAAYGIEVTP